jgi:hypothetical protein
MTQHEKKLLVTGLALGLMLALVAYAATAPLASRA